MAAFGCQHHTPMRGRKPLASSGAAIRRNVRGSDLFIKHCGSRWRLPPLLDSPASAFRRRFLQKTGTRPPTIAEKSGAVLRLSTRAIAAGSSTWPLLVNECLLNRPNADPKDLTNAKANGVPTAEPKVATRHRVP